MTAIETSETFVPSTDVGGVTSGQLRSFVERIERLSEDRKALSDDISEIYNEAKSTGYDVKVLRKIIALRSKDPDAVSEEEATLELYRAALGM